MAADGSNGDCPGFDHCGQVDGTNWLIPSAPLRETACGFQPDSCWICEAITDGGAAAHIDPASITSDAYFAGTVPARSPPPVPVIGGGPADAGGGSSSTVVIATSPSASTVAVDSSHFTSPLAPRASATS